jgi:hypothetical protein
MFAELTAAGHHRRAPFLTDFDACMCMVDDPDGNTILITAGWLPGSLRGHYPLLALHPEASALVRPTTHWCGFDTAQ